MVKRPITPNAELGAHSMKHVQDRFAEKRAPMMMSAPVRHAAPTISTPVPTVPPKQK